MTDSIFILQIPTDVFLLIVDQLEFIDVCRLSMVRGIGSTCYLLLTDFAIALNWLKACQKTRMDIRTYPLLCARKVLSAFALQVSSTTKSVGLAGMSLSTEQSGGTLSFAHSYRLLSNVHIGSWSMNQSMDLTACDSGIFALLRVAAPQPILPDVRVCHVAAFTDETGRIPASEWDIIVSSGHPLMMSLSADLDMLALLCIRDT